MKQGTKNIGTCELVLNGFKISSEIKTTLNETYISQDLCISSLVCELLGYYSTDELIGLPELRMFLQAMEILGFELIDKETKEVVKSGKCCVARIKVTYPDADVSRIKVKLIIQ